MGAPRSVWRATWLSCWLSCPLSCLLSAALSCGYAPDFAGGQLQCGAGGLCPKGYTCATDNRCWKGGVVRDGGNPTDTGSSSDATVDPLLNFIGTWNFNGGSLNASCTDGSSIQRALTGDFIVVSRGGAGLLAQYYCQDGWSLRLPPGSTTAAAPTGQMCVERTTDSASGVMTTYTWSALDLSFTTANGQTATSAGHLTGPFSATDNTVGTCTITFTGPLRKS